MNVLFVSIGTAGDVYPYVGMGIALRDRGHDITLVTTEQFKPLALRHGFDFVATGTAEEYEEALKNPDLWKSIEGGRTLGRWICEWMPAQYQIIADHYEPGNTVLVASGGAFGARIANEKLGVPMATIALQPALFRSAYKMPVVAGAPPIPDWLPPFTKRALLRVVDVVIDHFCQVSKVNAFRGSLGLAPVKRLVKDWWLSPQRVIALFPDWYGSPQPDWPRQLRMTGFPLYDDRPDGASLPAEVRSFIEQGDPPIAFTPGTGMMHGHDFFEAAVQACQLLGRRGILLTKYTDQLPKHLPSSVRHFSYVPFSQLLPHLAALVHHGGVGSLAQAMAAGIPQLVMPLAYDQPDNAKRLKRLGVGDSLKPKAFRGPAVAKKLRHLLDSPDVAARCQTLARKVNGAKSRETTCDLIEQLVENPVASAACA